METIRTPLTEKLGISKPVILAGMNIVAGAGWPQRVSNAGGLGIIGGGGIHARLPAGDLGRAQGWSG